MTQRNHQVYITPDFTYLARYMLILTIHWIILLTTKSRQFFNRYIKYNGNDFYIEHSICTYFLKKKRFSNIRVNHDRTKDHVTSTLTKDRRRANNISSSIFDTVRQSRKNERTNESRLLSSDRKTTVKSTIARGPTMDR